MPIKKRAESVICKCIIREFRMDGPAQVITAQRIDNIRIKTEEGVDYALINRQWVVAERIEAEKRGGCTHQVYTPSQNAQIETHRVGATKAGETNLPSSSY